MPIKKQKLLNAEKKDFSPFTQNKTKHNPIIGMVKTQTNKNISSLTDLKRKAATKFTPKELQATKQEPSSTNIKLEELDEDEGMQIRLRCNKKI